MNELRLAELIGARSYALDITEGQPAGHSVRCCLIGMRLGRALELPESLCPSSSARLQIDPTRG